MSNLLASLGLTAGTLNAFERSLAAIQNNVANLNTPGYARQQQSLVTLPFNPADGLLGGVKAGPMLSSRSEYLEQSVRRQQEHLGQWSQRSDNLSQVEARFDLTGQSGIPRALNALFGGFSQLSVTPNSTVGRQTVIERARDAAEAFHETALSFTTAGQNADRRTRDVVAGINRLAAQIAGLNGQVRSNAGGREDAGLDAKTHAAMEELAELADFTALRQDDGSVTIFLGGETPLVIGDRRFAISADFSSPQTMIEDAQGNDITSKVRRGRLGALLETKNTTLPAYTVELNQLAQSFADGVNGVLAGGVDRNGQPPALDLFSYDAVAGAASTLAVTAIAPDEIAAALASAPGGNGNAIAVAQLATLPAASGFTFTEAYGNLGARVGRDLNSALENREIQKDLVTQARTLREEASGVSLDEEAAHLIQMQRSYQAASKMVGVLDELTLTLVNLIR